MKKSIIILSALFCMIACSEKKQADIPLLDAKDFTTTIGGKDVSLYTLESGNGLYMQVTNYGGRVVTLWVSDRKGNYEDVVLGFESIERYLNNGGERYMGPVVGRFANRIAKGQFVLDGVTYQVPVNNNGQSLHGGLKGLDSVVWDVEHTESNEITMTYVSPDGEEGYPGTVTYCMTYTLTPDNEFVLKYHATTDKPTVINLSHHGLFNLKGQGNGTITDHILMIKANGTTPVDNVLIPTGEIAPVDGTPFDFRTPTAIGARIDEENEQLKHGKGYDHNWVIARETANDVELIASLYEPNSGRFMEIYTDQPGIQFYSGNFFNGKVTGKYEKTFKFREGLALETQKFPDSPNKPQFPSTRLDPGEEYTQTCIYKFSVK